jgi:sugar/nucleoside kinase (ribokinase family)
MLQENNKDKIDILAIGDVMVDHFIKLKDADVHCNLDRVSCELCVPFGEKIPYESVTPISGVGNSANAAVAAARLGLRSALLTNVGDDRSGKDCFADLKKEKVNTDFIKIEKGKKTNQHYVLQYGAERTILIKHEEYNYEIPDTLEGSWLYLSSLGENSLPFHFKILAWLEKHPATKLVFQPGTFQIKLGFEKLKDIYARTEIFLCNKEEAEIILGTGKSEIPLLLKKMQDLGPKIVVISDGPKGAYLRDQENNYFIPMYPDPDPPVDRTGAGDAFSSTIVSALILGKTLPEALAWGGINSMSVVQYIGAQAGLLSHEKIEEYLKNAPDYYKATICDKKLF